MMTQNWTTGQIRKSFTDFFVKNGHALEESGSLVPQNDPTLLFTNAGMVPFKDVFLGKEKRPYTRATSVQKCVRAGGKHNDLENVGFTARHHTFFEMLGNFSFGDYFKEEAIALAWELSTKVWGLPAKRIMVSVFREDDEAENLWRKIAQLPSSQILRLGEKDNFWSMGDTGPCGPCSELYIDLGPQVCVQNKCTGCKPGDDHCTRYLEFWNLVFMQFNRVVDANAPGGFRTDPLAAPCVDTGAGLERVSAILQGVNSNFEIESFREIIQASEALYKVPYKGNEAAFHVLADHARCCSFLIADGVFASNEGRGYVLRRILRRAIRFAKQLQKAQKNLKSPAGTFNQVCAVVVDQMQGVYPELGRGRTLIDKLVSQEEEQFSLTLERGLSVLEEAFGAEESSAQMIDGQTAFKLYDTYGFPFDLTRLIAKERKWDVDEAGFDLCLDEQKNRSRKAWKGSGDAAVSDELKNLVESLKSAGEKSSFIGYSTLICKAKLLAVITKVSQEGVNQCVCVFDKTPFYAEGGGQVGDSGQMELLDGSKTYKVIDTQKLSDEFTYSVVEADITTLKPGDEFLLSVDKDKRLATQKNHSATHLLNGALRRQLGDHVKQAGSLVNSEGLRFDFTHFQALSREQVQRIEDEINTVLSQQIPVDVSVEEKQAALEKGVVAMFGEKYGDFVRVVKMGDASVEFCGGTHVSNSIDIQAFKIIKEESVASGVRRIAAVTGQKALSMLFDQDRSIKDLYEHTKMNAVPGILDRWDYLVKAEKSLRTLEGQQRSSQMDKWLAEIAKAAHRVDAKENDRLVLFSFHKNHPTFSESMLIDNGKDLRSLAERMTKFDKTLSLVLMCQDQDKLAVVVSRGTSATWSAKDRLSKILALCEGRGGGKDDFAQGVGSKVPLWSDLENLLMINRPD